MARINLGKVVPQKGVDYFTDAEVAQIKAEMESDVNTRIGAAETRITTAEGNITSNTNAISALTTRVGTAEGNITTNRNNISTLNGKVTSLENDMTTAKNNIQTNAGDIATLNTQQTTQDTNIATNATDIDNLEEVVGIDTDTYDYDTTKTYEIGDFTVYNKKIYRCIQAVTTPGEFNANYWEEIYILNHFDTINDEQKAQDEKITQLETDKAMLEDLIPTDNAEGETIDIDDSTKYYFKEFVPEGQTEQGIPEEYQAVEYIEGTGTQYIDTGFKPNQDSGIEMTFVPMSATFFCGAREASGSNSFSLAATSVAGMNIRSDYGTNENTVVVTPDVKHTYKKEKNLLYIDDELRTRQNVQTFNCPVNLYLFGINTNGTITAGSGELYSCKIYDNNTLIRDYVPCYRKSDNIIGIYDLVTKTFYTNAGTGSFTKGNDVNLPTPERPFFINKVTGENKIKVENRNLFTGLVKGIGIDSSNGAQITDSNWAASDYISVDFTQSDNYFLWGLTNTLQSFVSAYNENKVFLGRTSGSTRKSITLTPSSFTGGTPQGIGDIKYLRVTQWKTSDNPGTIDDIDNLEIQLEPGTIATPYIPHEEQTVTLSLGNIEMNRIGNYADSMLKENGNWYKYEVIGKRVLTGDLGFNYNETNNVFYKSNLINYLNTGFVPYSDYYKGQDISGYGALNNYSIGFLRGTSNRIAIKNTDFTNADDFNNWLSTHHTTVYYVKASPTKILITDTILTKQLDALQKLMSYKGKTIISQENDGEKMWLKVVYRKDPSISEANTKSEIESIKARLELLES